MTYILIDIGGTKTKVTYSTDKKTIAEPVIFSTPSTPEAGVMAIVEAVQSFGDLQPITAAVGIRGQLDEDKQYLQYLQPEDVLSAWLGFPLAKALNEALHCTTYLENDTALAGLGEASVGAGKGFDLVVYHSISTGVGGVRIDDGSIDHASIGFEPGHQILDIDRTVLGEDVTPTLENLVSGTAVAERMGVPAYEIPQDDILWDQLAQYLGQGLRNSILYWSPEVIVLGGAMIVGNPRIEIDAIRRHTVAALDGFTEAPHIIMAGCGDRSALHGGIVYLKQRGE